VRTIAVLGALDDEVNRIAQALSDTSTHTEAGVSVVSGTFGDLSVVVTAAGMGLVNAGATTQYLITKYAPEALLFSGIAGSLNPQLDINDVIIGRDLHYLDSDMDFIGDSAPFMHVFHSDPQLVELADSVLAQLDVNHLTGVIVSGNRFITGERKAGVLEQVPGADAVEMEGAAIAHICARNSVPCLILRAMSDKADLDSIYQSDDFDTAAFVKNAAETVIEILKRLA
jgi:adenosylhomocysteine nucleosidase